MNAGNASAKVMRGIEKAVLESVICGAKDSNSTGTDSDFCLAKARVETAS